MKMKKFYTALLVLGLAITANAQSSYKLDSTFNGNGAKVFPNFPNHTIRGCYLNTDGSMVIATQTDYSITNKRAIGKVNANGSMDNSMCGSVCTDTTTGNSFYTDVFRLGSNYYIGSTGYGGDAIIGNATTVEYQNYDATAKKSNAIVQFDNNTIIEGVSGQGEIYAYKVGTAGGGYNSTKASGIINGATYPYGGTIAPMDAAINGITINALGVQSGNKILAAGSRFVLGINADRPFIVRYKPNSLIVDSTFGTYGIVTLANIVGEVTAMVIDKDDKIFVTYYTNGLRYFSILNADGTYNTNAVNGGQAISIPFTIYKMLVTPQGNIIMGIDGGALDGGLLSFTKLGAPDNSFYNGTNKILFDNFINSMNYTNINDIAADSYGNLAISGYSTLGGTQNWQGTIVRLKSLNPVIPTSVNDVLPAKSITTYPNPASNTIEFTDVTLSNNAQIIITSIDGKVINNTKLVNNKIDISNLQTGVYFIQIEYNTNIYTTKFMKL
jgi:hypothetical protein